MVCFRATDGAVCIMDMGSAHGTFLNGRPCKRVRGMVCALSGRHASSHPEHQILMMLQYQAQDHIVELQDGAELRFGASTRVYVVRRPPPARKRSVSWPDTDGE